MEVDPTPYSVLFKFVGVDNIIQNNPARNEKNIADTKWYDTNCDITKLLITARIF